jgi:hypothetical protein
MRHSRHARSWNLTTSQMLSKSENFGCAIRSVSRKTHMDTTTLLIIVLVILLLGGGGWYGRGRWY